MSKSITRTSVALTILLAMQAAQAHAANLTWDTTIAADSTISDGAGTWTAGSGGWNNGTTSSGINFTTGDNVTFGSGGALAASAIVTLGGATTTVGSLNFNYTGINIYSIGATANSQTIAFTGGSGSINVAGAPTNNAIINAVVAGNYSVTGTGNKGVIVMGNGTQTNANTLTVNANSLLQAGNNSSTGSFGAANITNNGTVNFRRSGTLNMNNVISGTGSVSYQLRGATVNLNAAGSYAGTTTFTPIANAAASTVNWGVTNALPTGTAVTIQTLANGPITFNLKGFNQTIASLAGTGTTTDSIITSTTTTGSIITSTLGTLTIGGTTNTAFSGLLSGGLALTRSGTGIQTLTGSNTYSGGTTITGGTLATGATGSFGSNSISVSSGAFLTLGNTASIGDTATLNFAGTSLANSISLNYTGTETVGSVFNSFTGTFLDAGTSYTAAQLNSLFSGNAVFTGTGLLTISASPIPEPSTYAALAGLAVLGAILIRRRPSV
jgi:hypothetical protein